MELWWLQVDVLHDTKSRIFRTSRISRIRSPTEDVEDFKMKPMKLIVV